MEFIKPKLYGYWRSGATYRVRIALFLKNIDFDYEIVNSSKEGGHMQHSAEYTKLNPLNVRYP